MAVPEQYECKECGACWAERKAKRCISCTSKDIRIMWNPNKKGKERWPT